MRGNATRTVAGGHVLVLTGVAGSGKTTRCRALVQAARENGLLVRGLTAPVEASAGGAKRWVEDLSSGERRLLGREASPAAIAAGAPHWRLDDTALAWSDAVLSDACPADLLVIDEVGPVELLRRRGTLAGVERALAGPYGLAVVVVRPSLVPRFRQLFPAPPAELVDVGDSAALDAHLAGLIEAHRAAGRVEGAGPARRAKAAP